jgi:hypothetical protein
MSELVPLLVTFNPGDVAIVKSLLDSAGIEYFASGEGFCLARPLVEPVRFLVRADQVEEARELLQDLDLNYLGTFPLAPRGPTGEPEGTGE